MYSIKNLVIRFQTLQNLRRKSCAAGQARLPSNHAFLLLVFLQELATVESHWAKSTLRMKHCWGPICNSLKTDLWNYVVLYYNKPKLNIELLVTRSLLTRYWLVFLLVARYSLEGIWFFITYSLLARYLNHPFLLLVTRE